MKELSEFQRIQLTQTEEKWLSIGLSVSATDRAQAEKSVDEIYREAGRRPPRFKIWFESPWKGVLAAVMLAHDRSWAGAQIQDKLLPSFKGKIQQRLEAENLSDTIKNEVSRMRARVSIPVESHRDLIWNRIAPLWDQTVGTETWTGVAGPIWEDLRSRIGISRQDCPFVKNDEVTVEQGNRCGYGLHDSGWLAYYDFFAQLLSWGHHSLTSVMTLAEVCGWWWPFEDAVVLTEKPLEIYLK